MKRDLRTIAIFILAAAPALARAVAALETVLAGKAGSVTTAAAIAPPTASVGFAGWKSQPPVWTPGRPVWTPGR